MKRRGISVLLIITALAICFYGYRYLKIPVQTVTASITQIEDCVTTDAYVIRQEMVYKAENAGTMYNYVSEGARVAKDMKISTVYRGDVNEELVQELNNVDLKIEQLNQIKANNEAFTIDNSSVENKISVLTGKIISAAIENDISQISQYKSSINALNNNEADTSDTELYDLQARKQNIEMQLSNDKNDIYSTMSGVFSLNVDGLEDILTPENIKNYTVTDFRNLGNPQFSQRTKNIVSAGESICKVVDNHTWYAMAVVPKNKAEEMQKEKSVLLRFESLPGAEVSASVSYVSQEGENSGETVVIFKSDRYLEGVYGIRSGSMDIVISRYTGFRVPIYAIRNINGKRGVLISEGNAELFCECNIVHTDNEKEETIIYPSSEASRELKIGDKIIIGEKKKDATVQIETEEEDENV